MTSFVLQWCDQSEKPTPQVLSTIVHLILPAGQYLQLNAATSATAILVLPYLVLAGNGSLEQVTVLL